MIILFVQLIAQKMSDFTKCLFQQKTVEIKTERGAKLCIKPPLEYSEDFEPYESLNMDTNADDPLHYSQVQLAVAFYCSRQCQLKCEQAQVLVLTRACKPSIYCFFD